MGERMRLRGRTKLALLAVLALAVVALTASAGTATGASAAGSLIPRVGTGGPQTGPFTPWDGTSGEEVAGGEEEEGPAAFAGNIVDRSLSSGPGQGASATSGQTPKSHPKFDFGFQGLNHYQQRYSRGGNQFSVEPPDQGMCAGNGYVVEAVNDVFNVYSQATGASVLPDNTATNIVGGFPRNVNHTIDLNSVYGYGPAINRTTGVRGEFVTDPSCLYDAATQRFFVLSLTLDPQVMGPCQGVFSCVNHLDLAVSQTANPTGSWNIYRIDVTNDGTNAGGVNPG